MTRTLTVAALLGWRPDDLAGAGDDVELCRRQVDAAEAELSGVVRSLGTGWSGEAADAAAGALCCQIKSAQNLIESLALVRRTLYAACDAIGAARALLVRAQGCAAEGGLHLEQDGRVLVAATYLLPTDVSPQVAAAASDAQDQLVAVAEQAQAQACQALAAATEADADSARALRAALDATSDRSATSDDSRVAAITARAIPDAGTTPSSVGAWWASLPVAAQGLLLARHPGRLGNLDGVPYDVRVTANTAVIGATMRRAQHDEATLEARIAALRAQLPAPGTLSAGGRGYPDPAILGALSTALTSLATSRASIARYQELLTGTTYSYDATGARQSATGHQVVLFDPAHGRFAEVVGTLTPSTESIGMLVGGTGTNATTMDGEYARAFEFVEGASPYGSLAVITYLGGPMPQTIVPEAAEAHFALAQAEGLRDFAAGIDRPEGATVTAIGHSYGGSVVGAAEHAGMVVDRVVHVESAGAGPGVGGVEDYAAPDTPRYSMTAPGDPIGLIQGTQIGSVGHGADPDLLSGVVRLETGRVDNSDPASPILEGVAAHTAVFTKDSTAWTNMLNVMTGHDVMLFTEPTNIGNSFHNFGYRYPMESPTFTPPTSPVR